MTTPTTEEKEIERVTRLIRGANLTYPDWELLESFLLRSKDALQTARYILQRCPVLGDGTGLDLSALLADWKRLIAFFMPDRPAHPPADKAVIAAIFKRDGGKCCITGFTNSFWDPLVVVPLLPVGTFHVDKELREMLGIFIGPELLEWFSSKAANRNAYQSHWLVRRSAAAAVSHGYFCVSCQGQSLKVRVSLNLSHSSDDRSPRMLTQMQYNVYNRSFGDINAPSITRRAPVDRWAKFSDPSSSHIENPDTSALQLLEHFSEPFLWTHISRQIAHKKPQTQPIRAWRTPSVWRFLSEGCATVMSMAWRLLPAFVRIRAYRGLAFLGFHMYGGSCSFSVQRLPFGMYLKVHRDRSVLENEYAALQLVRRHTLVPVPQTLDLVSDSSDSYLLTTKLPGKVAGAYIDTLSDSEETALVHDLQEALSQLRAIPKQVAPEYAIASVLGKACRDGRITSLLSPEMENRAGPFVDESAFHDLLRIGALPDVSQHNGHRIVFTHGDLNPRNILIHNGRFSGIVDWAFAGWMPEYWEYTKIRFATRLNQRWLRVTGKALEPFGNFEKELEIESKFWWYF
ncbi:hypothetical protein E4U53_000917 [Claviceps sorghi]|nr:hypothetical protein E4U53_000917 [Claviceps sorghi]